VLLLCIGLCSIDGCAESEYKDKVSIFNDRKRDMDMRKISWDDLVNKEFYVFDVPKNTMFNPVYLPFEYKCKSGKADPLQSLTFPSLLSIKYDLVPDNYSTRHPMFIYHRDDDSRKVELGDPKAIAAYIKDWKGTHGIGGTLVQHGELYSGRIVIFDSSAQVVLKREYTKPIPYFDLMGKMTKAWFEHKKIKINRTFNVEIMRPMTKDLNLLRLFGESFEVEFRSQDHWEIYERILHFDPDFAEVRWWYGNQKRWEDGDKTRKANELLLALKSNFVIPALEEINLKDSDLPNAKQLFKKSMKYAQNLFPDHPSLVSQQMSGKDWKKMPKKQRNRYLDMVQRYPASWLCTQMQWLYREWNRYEYALPICLGLLQSGYTTYDCLFPEYTSLIYMYHELGLIPEATYVLFKKAKQTRRKHWWYECGAYVFRELGDNASAIKFFMKANKDNKRYINELWGLMTMFEAGRMDLVDEYIAENKGEYCSKSIPALVNARLALAKGDFKQCEKILHEDKIIGDGWSTGQTVKHIILADCALMQQDHENAKKHIRVAHYYTPRKRRINYLHKKAFTEPCRETQRYAWTMSKILPQQKYWQKFKDEAGDSFLNETEEELYREFLVYKDKMAAKQIDLDFLKTNPPMEFEYICLKLMENKDNKYYDEVVEEYDSYAWSHANKYSSNYFAHGETLVQYMKNQAKKIAADVGFN